MAPVPSCSGTRMSESLCRYTFYLCLKLLATKLHHLSQITKFVFGRLPKAKAAFKQIRAKAERGETPELTLDEINEEISEVRRLRKERNGICCH